MPGAAWIAFAILAVLVAQGCKDDEDQKTGGGPVGGPRYSSVESWSKKKDAQADADEAGGDGKKRPSSAEDSSREQPNNVKLPDIPSYEVQETTWGLGEVHDLGPAAPITAVDDGVLFVSIENRLYLAKRRGKRFVELKAPPELFAKYGRGPGVTTDHAYWVSRRGQLIRASLQTGEPEPLLDGARGGARVSALRVRDRDLVAFIRSDGSSTVAYLWASGGDHDGEVLRLSPEGSTATSARLVEHEPHPRAIVLEGRTSMSPVHLRTVRVTRRRVTLADDKVVWVGPGSHALTEIETLDRPGGESMAFLATAKDITSFGLAQLYIDSKGSETDDPTWRLYPNGLDPAPVNATHLCGDDWAFFAVPTEKRPGSPQELRIAHLGDHQLENEEILARSRAFNDISVQPVRGGAVLAWTADRRSWAMVISCPPA